MKYRIVVCKTIHHLTEVEIETEKEEDAIRMAIRKAQNENLEYIDCIPEFSVERIITKND